MLSLPAFYPIVDSGLIAKRGLAPLEVTDALLTAGAQWIQFRHKGAYSREAYELAAEIGQVVKTRGAQYIVNDRVDVALMLGADGVHVGQDDLPPAEVRKLVGDRLFIGFSTHNESQFLAGDREPVDYLALGPLFGTTSKQNPDPVVGVAELKRLRLLSTKPLVTIGGITRENAPEAFAAGADSVSVISDFLADDWRRSIAEWAALKR